jgi:hypothetical protein
MRNAKKSRIQEYNITVVNLTLTQTEATFLESYEALSVGDWLIHGGGTVFMEGVDGFTLQQCLFDSHTMLAHVLWATCKDLFRQRGAQGLHYHSIYYLLSV